MRIQSDMPCKNGGWLHAPGNKPVRLPPPTPPTPRVNPYPLVHAWRQLTELLKLSLFANTLGVSVASLRALDCVWSPDHQAWAFPMKDAAGKTIGIRLRSNSGYKWTVTGTRTGVFIPRWESHRRMFVVEGPTDTAAGLTMGLWCVGRPSCSGGVDILCGLVRRMEVREVVVVADNDGPGQEGARRLSEQLPCRNCVYTPITKDIRAFKNSGGTRAMIESTVAAMRWTNPK